MSWGVPFAPTAESLARTEAAQQTADLMAAQLRAVLAASTNFDDPPDDWVSLLTAVAILRDDHDELRAKMFGR